MCGLMMPTTTRDGGQTIAIRIPHWNLWLWEAQNEASTAQKKFSKIKKGAWEPNGITKKLVNRFNLLLSF